MANITATKDAGKGPGYAYTWADVDENDTPLASLVEPGRHMVSVEGDFSGSLEVEIKAAIENASHKSLPHPDGTATITFSAQTDEPVLITLCHCYVLPVVSGGSSAEVNIYLYPVTVERGR